MKGLAFSRPMALAVNEGIKTVTRRLTKGEIPDAAARLDLHWANNNSFYPATNSGKQFISEAWSIPHFAPYAVGDLLYVKEPYVVSAQHDSLPPSKLPIGVTVQYLADVLEADEPELRGRYRHARFMPQVLSRNTVRVVNVLGERVNAITPDEALKEGFAPYIVENILYPLAMKAKPDYAYYVVYLDNSHEPTGQRCKECAEKYAAANSGGDLIGPMSDWDSDSFPGCEECGRLLKMSYTDHAVESELANWEEHPNNLGTDSLYVMWDMIGCNFPSAFEAESLQAAAYNGNVGKLARCAFIWLWNQLHPATPFQQNPMVWRIEFEVVEGVSHAS